MVMAVVGMTKSYQANTIDYHTEQGNKEELLQPVHLGSFAETLDSFPDDFNAN